MKNLCPFNYQPIAPTLCFLVTLTLGSVYAAPDSTPPISKYCNLLLVAPAYRKELTQRGWTGAEINRLRDFLDSWAGESLEKVKIEESNLVIEDIASTPYALPSSEELLEYAKDLPFRTRLQYVFQMRSARGSKAWSLNDLIGQRLLTAQTITSSFTFFTTIKINLNSLRQLNQNLNITVDIRNGGSNTNSTLRPGTSGDWIAFIAQKYSDSLSDQGAIINDMNVIDSRHFSISLSAPVSNLDQLAPYFFLSPPRLLTAPSTFFATKAPR